MWLGNPFGRKDIEKIFIPEVNRRDVRAVEALSKEPSKFALALVDVFFFSVGKHWQSLLSHKRRTENVLTLILLRVSGASNYLLCMIVACSFTTFGGSYAHSATNYS